MAERVIGDRLQPSLLDRLQDDQPQQRTERAEARAMTRGDLRRAVLRDLTWLFNATRLEPSRGEQGSDAWAAASYASRSVINLGLPALSGRSVSTLDFAELERMVRDAIVRFEPRIDAASVDVQAVGAGLSGAPGNTVRLRIRGNLWGQPMPLELLLHTDLDIETGLATVREGN